MAKVLKFGLMLDDCNVRSLEGLQEHFVIEDVLKYFEDGTLSRWLKVWGYKEQLATVEAIDKTLDKKDIVLQLANIFGIEDVDAADIEKALSVFSYLDKKQKFQVTVQENALFKKQAVEEYLAGYEALIQDMIDNSGGDIATKLRELEHSYNNQCPDRNFYGSNYKYDKWKESEYINVDTGLNVRVDALKSDIQKLENDYLQLVEMGFYEFYFSLVSVAPMALIVMLTNDTFRELLIGNSANEYIKDSFTYMYSKRCILGSVSGHCEYGGPNSSLCNLAFGSFVLNNKLIPKINGLRTFCRGYFEGECIIEPPEKKVIVLFSSCSIKFANCSDYWDGSPKLVNGLIARSSVSCSCFDHGINCVIYMSV